MKILKIIKWVFLLTFVFLAAICAGPFFMLVCWLDGNAADSFLDHLGDQLKNRLIKDFSK